MITEQQLKPALELFFKSIPMIGNKKAITDKLFELLTRDSKSIDSFILTKSEEETAKVNAQIAQLQAKISDLES